MRAMKQFIVLLLLVVLGACNVENSANNQSFDNKKSSNLDPVKSASNVTYIIDDGSSIVNNQHIEQGLKRPKD